MQDNNNVIANSKVLSLKLSASQSPKLFIDLYRSMISWGSDNKYPQNKLLYWYENSAIHGAICKGKSRYLSGTKIEAKEPTPQCDQWLKKANPFESWHSLLKKITLDEVICGGFFLKITTNIFGNPLQYYHVDFSKCRISEDGKFIRFSEDWFDTVKYPIIDIPIWTEGHIGTSIYYYKSYAPAGTKINGTYPKPEYDHCSQDIDTDARVSIFFNSLVRNNFSAGTIVTIRNGTKDKEAKANLAEKLKGEHSGEENAGKPIIIFVDKDGQPTEVVSLNPNDLDKQYEGITKRNQQNIIAGHGVNGVLFKIKTEGQLGTRTELIEAHELFINEYVRPNQVTYLDLLSKFYELRFGELIEFEFDQIKPIGKELPLDNQNVINAIGPAVFKKYIFDTYGIESTDEAGIAIEAATNDHLKGLTAADNADLLRVVRDFQRGRSGMTEAMALHRIMSYGISDADARRFLGMPENVQQSKEKYSLMLEKVIQYSHEINLSDEVLDIQNVKFADVLSVSIKDLRNSILTELQGNPSVPIKELSKKYQITEKEVKSVIDFLVEKKLVISSADGFTPTEKGVNKETGKPIQTEIYTEYVYGLREDQAGTPLILSTTRDFCKDMVNMTRSRALSFESIKLLENEFGEDAWNFRGGFYNNGTQTTPFCRHVWKAVTKIRRK